MDDITLSVPREFEKETPRGPYYGVDRILKATEMNREICKETWKISIN